ncbi:MAG: hypothetical protein QGG53_43350 [Planctomycetota bacterium]|nr:hypothetical protein [Planctomycetota bacterium]
MKLTIVLILALPLLHAQDRDKDGLPDHIEAEFGSDPDSAETFKLVINDGLESEEHRKRESYDPTKDFLHIEHCNVAEGRSIWKATFAEAPTPKNAVFHLYVDSDANNETGRRAGKGASATGTDYMISVVGGRGGCAYYAPDGTRTAGPAVSFFAQGKDLFVACDAPLDRDGKGIRYALYVLSHTLTSYGKSATMSDYSRKVQLSGLPISKRKKILRAIDHKENFNVDAMFGLDELHRILLHKDATEIRHDQLEIDGFYVDHQTSRRFPHLSLSTSRARAWCTAPVKGRHTIGFMMYDDGADERIEILINGKSKGLAVSNQNNYRTWLYWLRDPVDLKGDEKIELKAVGANGKHAVINLLFLKSAPKPRRMHWKVENLVSKVLPVAPGEVTISWTTTMPSKTVFEFGDGKPAGKRIEDPYPHMVHRVVLRDLPEGKVFQGRAIGMKLDDSPYASEVIEFSLSPPKAPESVAETVRVPLKVQNIHDVEAKNWPVSSGVPIPQGRLGSSENVRLIFPGEDSESQIEVTARWPDASVKWLLVSFLADVPARSTATYELEFGKQVKRAGTASPIAKASEEGIALPGASIDRMGRLHIRGNVCETSVIDITDRDARPRKEAEITLESNGPVRAVVKTVSTLSNEDGSASFTIEKRIEAWRGVPFVRVHHTFLNSLAPTFTNIDELSYVVANVEPNWDALRVDGSTVSLTPTRSVQQHFDSEFVHHKQKTKGRLNGSIISTTDSGLAIAVRDFWQNYPKSFSVTSKALVIGLCPDFEPGLYDSFPFEREGHQLYYYLRDGHYRFKSGMAKTHEMLIGAGNRQEREAMCTLFQRPLIATAPPEWYCESKALYDIAPRNPKKFKLYEEGIDHNLERYKLRREQQHDYGLMNYGDWYGERGANWGNVEYDTQFSFFQEYVRSGNADAFVLGKVTELHNRDIDTLHWAANPKSRGLVYVHQMGHVGGYYTKSVPGTLGIPRAGGSIGHAWAEGHFAHYFLTGDRRSYETGKLISDFFIHKHLGRPYDFSSCRVPGWHLIMNSSAYAATGDPYYLNASRVIVDRVLENQDRLPLPMPEHQFEKGMRTHQIGGWTRQMVPGHCRCTPRHRGNAGFMVAVLLSGLKYYHDVTGDPRVKECIIRGAHFLLDECWSNQTQGFRYTSCPKTTYGRGANPLMIEGVARAYRWTKDNRFLPVVKEGMAIAAQGSGYGKGFSFFYRCAPRVLADLDAAGLTVNERPPPPPAAKFEKPDWMKKLKPEEHVVLQAESYSKQEGGIVDVRDDRMATWGKMITRWHSHIGHALEWSFEIPADGNYKIIFRYATAGTETRRRLKLDGKRVEGMPDEIEFERTGGYGTDHRHWRFKTLETAEEKEVVVPLKAGKHTIRMTNLGDGLGMDFILLVRK